MSDELKDSILNIKLGLDHLKVNSPTNRDFDRLDMQVSQLRESVNAILVKLDNAKDVDITPAIRAIERVDAKADTIFNKIPPLPSLIAASVIVIGVLGLSYKDLQSMSKPITDASVDVQSTTKALKDSVSEVKADFESIKSLTKDLSSNLKKISDLDKALSKMLAEVQRISTSSNLISNKSVEQSKGESTDLESLLGSLGDALPVEMKLLMDARAAITNYEYAKARDLAAKAKILDSDKGQSIYDSIIASSFYEEGKYREAIGAYSAAIDLEPTESSYHNNLGSTYYALAKEIKDDQEKKSLLEKSIAATRESIKLDPTSASVFANGSMVLNELNKPQEAMELLSSWEGEPSAKIEYQKAATSALMGNASKTIGFLGDAIKIDRQFALHAAADDDFSSFRNNEGFKTILKTNLGDELFSAVLRAWEN